MCLPAEGWLWGVPRWVGLCAAIFVRASQKISAAIPHAGRMVRLQLIDVLNK
jgi:hypothetical protein